jgi:hypothetical protein
VYAAMLSRSQITPPTHRTAPTMIETTRTDLLAWDWATSKATQPERHARHDEALGRRHSASP